MKIFETTADLAQQTLDVGNIVWVKDVNGGLAAYHVETSGNGVVLANGNVAILESFAGNPASPVSGINSTDTVATMKSLDLPEGTLIETKGYHTAGDGGAAKYLIETSGDYGSTPDGYGDHALANGNVAVLQHNGEVNVLWFGAVGDGVADDTAAIQSAVDYVSSGVEAVYLSAGTYIVSNKITVSSRTTVRGDGYSQSVIENVGTTDAIEFTTTWNQCLRDIGVKGNLSSGNGLVVSSSNFIVENCQFRENGANGVYVTPQNWTITLRNCFMRFNEQDGVYAVPTGANGQINALYIDKCSLTLNKRHGFFGGGTVVNIVNSNIEGNESRGIHITTQFYSTYAFNITDNYIESNPDGHVFIDCYPASGYFAFKVNIQRNYMYMLAANTTAGASFVGAQTDTTYNGLVDLNFDSTNMMLTDTVPHVKLGDACSKQGQCSIEAVQIGDTANYDLFYLELGHAQVRTYQKTLTVNGYISSNGQITYQNIERSANVNAGILSGAMNVYFPLYVEQNALIKDVSCHFKSDNSDYSVTFNLVKVDAKNATTPVVISTQTFAAQANNKYLTVDFTALTSPENLRLKPNHSTFLEIVVQSNAGGGTYFYAYNPLITVI